MKKRDVCNVVQSHKRLLEAHRLWHQAMEAYFDPEGFRTNVNAAIQALRNVTFALQNEKQKIPGFDTWYPRWQERLKGDEIMRWLCDARTEIVHKKDLEMHSTATVTVRCYETILKASVQIPLFLSGKTILQFLEEQEYIDEAMKDTDAYAVVERRWAVEAFPQYDVLYLLAYGIGQLAQMVGEAHAAAGIGMDTCSVCDSLHPIALNAAGVPACMEFTQTPMREELGIRDYAVRRSHQKVIVPDARMNAKVRRRYRNVIQPSLPLMCSDPFAAAENVFRTAKQLLQKDGHHIHLLCLQTPDRKWSITSPHFSDQTAKYIFWHGVAERVRREGITAVIFAGECWLGSYDVYTQTGQRASQQPGRREVLAVDVFTSDLREKSHRVLFHRNKLGRVVFDEEITEADEDLSVGYIRPVLDVWRESAESVTE